MRIGVIGQGRLGSSLQLLLQRAGHDVRLVGREALPPDRELVLLCVPDAALASMPARPDLQGPLQSALWLHTAGALPSDLLGSQPTRGSFHPLMTFPGPAVGLPTESVPVALGGGALAVQAGHTLAQTLGWLPFSAPADRALYHAAAVIAGNFATVLLAEAATVLAAAGMPHEQAAALLSPLAIQSLRNAAQDPRAALTGPVARGDHATLAKHRAALEAHDLHGPLTLYDALVQRAEALRPAQTKRDNSS